MKQSVPTQECPICFENVPINRFMKHAQKHGTGGGNKFNARRVEYDGYMFASMDERDRYIQLKMMEQGGLIRDLELQPKFRCEVNGFHITTYKADFRYYDIQNKETIIEDVKGGSATRTEAYVIRKKLTQAIYGIKITEIKM